MKRSPVVQVTRQPVDLIDNLAELRQMDRKLHAPVGQGKDEHGDFLTIPLSMVRGGEAKPFKVHTCPIKHIILDQNVPPRGWYKPKFAKRRVRNRPCYAEAILTTPYGGFCRVNCAYCVSGDTKISTPAGDVRIDNLHVGDFVYGMGVEGLVESVVLGVSKRLVDSYYTVRTQDGYTLNVTGEHPVMTAHGWIEVADLEIGDDICTLPRLRTDYRESNTMEEVLQHVSLFSAMQDSEARQSCTQQSCFIGGSNQEVRTLRSIHRQPFQEVVRCLSTNPQGKDGPIEQRQKVAVQAQVGKMEEINVAKDDGQSKRGWMCQIVGMAREHGIANSQRSDGIQDQQAHSLRDERWPQNNLSVRMGMADGAISGRSRDGLGIRGNGVLFDRYARSILAGLSSIRFARKSIENSGGEGIFPQVGARQIHEIPEVICKGWNNFRVVGQDQIDGIRYTTVTQIERIDEPLMVYNIQTTVENFYANGLLVHNCYINNGTRGYRSTGLPTVDPEYPEKMRKRLKKMMVTGAAYISSFTESFQHSMENHYHVTERLTDVLLDEGIPLFYLSKLAPPEWVIDALLENPYSYMQWSINTSNQNHWHRMGPGAFSLEDAYREIEYYSGQGIYVSIQVNPIVAGITTLDEIVTLIENVHRAGAHHVIFKFVETVTMARKTNMKRFRKRGFDISDLDRNWSQVIGGVYSIAQDIRVEWLKVFLEETRRLGITMSTCYEYYDDGDAGTNLAPYFTTADQCHGRGVPMYYRPEPGAPFEPLPGCYRKGCLYCEDFGTCVCNNDRLLEAGALKYTDLCSIRLVGDEEDWTLPESCVRPEDACIYVDNPPVGNSGLQTDAELWGWDLDRDIITKRRFPSRDKDGNPLEEVPF